MENENSSVFNKQKKGRGPDFWRVIMRITQISIVLDVSFFFLFYALGSPILAWVNIFGVTMYTCAYYAVKKRKQRVAVALIWTEVILHAALGNILIGWESGFHYFLLIFIPAICISTSRKPAIIALSLLFGFYVGLDFLAWLIDPIQPINPIALNIVHLVNLSVVFILFGYLSFYYLETVRHAQKKLRIMATTDPLTKLLNRRYITHLADQEVQRLSSTNHSIGILLIDIDYFKKINDEHGHKVGDDVLVNVAEILRKQVRKQDLVARWGGEEFLIVLPEANAEEAELSAERIRKAFLTYDWLAAVEKEISPTVSAGVSMYKQTESLNAAIACADRALYKGKTSGRNRVEFGVS